MSSTAPPIIIETHSSPESGRFMFPGLYPLSCRLHCHNQLRAIILPMAIHMGIMCDACGTVHFIVTSPGILLSRGIGEPYQLTCKPPCSATKRFTRADMRPFRVSSDVFAKGYAKVGEYESVEGPITGKAS